MKYFIYNHDVSKDSFWGMPTKMLAEWNGEELTFYLSGPPFSIKVDDNGITSGIFKGTLEEMTEADYAKKLLTDEVAIGNRRRN